MHGAILLFPFLFLQVLLGLPLLGLPPRDEEMVVSLTKEARNLCVDYAGDPVHNKNLASRQLLCLLEDCDRLLNVAISAQDRQ